MTLPLRPAHRTANIRYAVRDILKVAAEAERAGKELLPLNIGDPLRYDFAPPPHMVTAVEKALRDGRHGYAPSPGTPEALAAIRGWAERKGLTGLRDVYVGNGASECIELALTALVNRGDEVLLPNPGYPLYDAVLAKLEAKAVFYPLDEAKGFLPDVAALEKLVTPLTRAIVVINPNNPTGSLTGKEALEGILDVARRKGLPVLSDEIYDALVFDGLTHTATASLAADVPVLTFGGLSKVYLACGWRLGWGVMTGPAEVVKPWVDAIAQLARARLCANYPMQSAIPAALEGPQDHIREMIVKLQRRRDLTMQGLAGLKGVTCVKPQGAFYAFPQIDTTEPDEPLIAALVRETGVVVVHGSGFGQALPKAHFRIVFAPPDEVLTKAYQRIGAWLAKRA